MPDQKPAQPETSQPQPSQPWLAIVLGVMLLVAGVVYSGYYMLSQQPEPGVAYPGSSHIPGNGHTNLVPEHAEDWVAKLKEADLAELSGKRVLIIDSYHKGQPWSDGEVKGAQSVLESAGVITRVVYMDTKRNPGEAFAIEKGKEVRDLIEQWQPDGLIALDDNASKYVIRPYYKDSPIPVAFGGVNWNGNAHGYPYSNATGIVEVAYIRPLIEELGKLTQRCNNVGIVSSDSYYDRTVINFYKQEVPDLNVIVRYVSTTDQWIDAIWELNDLADVVILNDRATIEDWDEQKAWSNTIEATRVPTGTMLPFLMDFSHIGYLKVAEEQGEVAAIMLKLMLLGTPASDIPIVENKQTDVRLNVENAQQAGFVFSKTLLDTATVYKTDASKGSSD